MKLLLILLTIPIILFHQINGYTQSLFLFHYKRNVISQINTKLSKKVNTYKIHTPSSFIPVVHADSALAEDTRAYVLVDFETGDVLAEKNLSNRLSIASLTKIMTAIVALDLASPDELFTVSKRAASQIPTKIVVLPGEKMSLWELLHASLLTSANDAAYVIQEGIDAKYAEPVFIDAMNKKAELIGLKNTHFVNSQGFDDLRHYSSAEDLAILSHYALKNYPLIDQIVKKPEVQLEANSFHQAHRLVNWNGLIGVYPGIYGLKIGNTSDAGMTSIVVSQRGGKKILAVVLGAPDVLHRDLQAAELLDFGYEQLMNLPPVSITEDQLYEKYATWN